MTVENSSLDVQGSRELPKGWRWVKLGEVCNLNPRRSLVERENEAPTSFVPMELVDALSGAISELRIRKYSEVKKGYTFFIENDILFAKITPCMQNGKHAIARGLIDGIGFGSTEFHVLRSSPAVIPEWIHCFVRQPALLQEATEHFTGAVGQQRLPEDYLANIEIPLPPLPEQQRIATLLKEQMAAVDKARAAAKERLAAIKALPAAFLRQVFPEPDQPLPNGWRWVKLGEVCKQDRQLVEPNTSEAESIIYYSLEHIESETGRILKSPVDQVEDEGKSTTFRFDDRHVLYGKLRPYLNKVALPLSAGRCTTELIPLLPGESTDRVFLAWLLRRVETVAFAMEGKTGSRMPRADMNRLLTLGIPLPSLSEQQRIAALLKEQMATIEKARQAAEAEFTTINTLPAALLRRAFNGEL